jgi:hypothetical protein
MGFLLECLENEIEISRRGCTTRQLFWKLGTLQHKTNWFSPFTQIVFERIINNYEFFVWAWVVVRESHSPLPFKVHLIRIERANDVSQLYFLYKFSSSRLDK